MEGEDCIVAVPSKLRKRCAEFNLAKFGEGCKSFLLWPMGGCFRISAVVADKCQPEKRYSGGECIKVIVPALLLPAFAPPDFRYDSGNHRTLYFTSVSRTSRPRGDEDNPYPASVMGSPR